MMLSNASSRLAVFVSLTLSLVTLGACTQDLEWLSSRHRMQVARRQVANASSPVTGVQDGSVAPRLEIRELQKNADQWNLYLLALLRLQEVDQSDEYSYYQIAGLHGRPYRTWGGVGPASGQQNNGYCTHVSVMFPPWHRPYLALYEQVLYSHVQEVAQSFNGADRDRYVRAAANFRIPYWDWAASVEGGVLPPSVGGSETVEVNSPEGRRTIRNPLYSYEFHPLSTDDFPSNPVRNWQRTLRYPTNTAPDAKSQNNLVSAQLDRNQGSYRDRLYNLFTAYPRFNNFSNKAWYPNDGGNYDSIESLHDQIHGLVGSGGHMSLIPYSAMDPIFFLHHTMADRVFAMWQVLYPDSYVEPERTRWGTYTTPRNSIEDVNTNLTPFFRDTQGNFWTPDTARDVRSFGYTYPELDGSGASSSEELRDRVRTAVNRLYGRNEPAPSKRRRDLAGGRRHLSRRNETAPGTGETPDPLSSEGKYREYIANIRTQKNALSTSFFVHVFLGNYSSHPCSWTFDPSLVGSHCVFNGGMDSEAMQCEQCTADTTSEVTGAIPLTSTLLEHIKDGRLASLDPGCVDPYLKENLHWRVTLVDDTLVANEDVPGLKVAVVSSIVEKAKSESDFPEWSDITVRTDITDKDPTGLSPGDQI